MPTGKENRQLSLRSACRASAARFGSSYRTLDHAAGPPPRRLAIRRREGGCGLVAVARRKRRGEWFSHALTALWATCDMARTRSMMSSAPWISASRPIRKGLRSRSLGSRSPSRDASHASVVANLTPDNWVRKSDRENEIRYDLVWQGGRWVIDDIHSVIEANPWSLRTILTQYLTR